MFRSATLKLTLWYMLLAACLCVLFSTVLYHFSTGELSEALHHQYNVLADNDGDHDNQMLPYQEAEDHAQRLWDDLVYFNILVIGVSSVASYFLARRTLRPIEEAHRAQVRFTAEASHELRTPLAAMRADTEVALMERGLDAKTRRLLRANVRDIQRLENLAGHLLDIARYKSTADGERRPLNLEEIISQTLKQFASIVNKKQLTVEQGLAPAQIMGDPYGISQLITIVLDNAVKYSNLGGRIVLTLRADHKDATFAVEDVGIGIPAEDLPHIFERFYRSGNVPPRDAAAGYGLGLPLAREVVEAHQGTIHISSVAGVGTRAVITLPIAKGR